MYVLSTIAGTRRIQVVSLMQATVLCWAPVYYQMDVDLLKAFGQGELQLGNIWMDGLATLDFYNATASAINGINNDLVDIIFSKTVPELTSF